MLDQKDKLAERIRELRRRQDMSLQELAEKSSVSRATLSRIENAEVSPNTDVLAKLCSAYGMSLSRLLAPLEMRFEALIKQSAQTIWRDDQAGFERRVVSPPSASLSSEVIRCELKPHSRITYDSAPVPGQEHHLVMLDGRLEITVGDQVYELKAGDCLRYRLSGSSCFATESDPATYILVLS